LYFTPSTVRQALLLRSIAWRATESDLESPSHGTDLRLFEWILAVQRREFSDLSSRSLNRATTGRDDVVLSPGGPTVD
jgi:hypothetical protein